MAVEAERLVVSLEANIKQYLNEIKKLDKANKDLFRRMQSEIERSGTRNEALMARMGERMARGMSRGFRRGMGTLLAAAGVSGFINAVQKSVRAVADLGDKAEDLGMRAANLQAWNRMMTEAGGNVESMARALSEVAEQSQDASSKLSKLFAANRRTVTGDVQKDMMTLLEILDKAKSAPQALRALEFVFGGKLGRQLAEPLRGGREAFTDAFNKNMREGIALTEDQIKAARELEESWNRIGLYFATRFAQAILDNFGSWEGFEEKAKQVIDATIELIVRLVQEIKNIGIAIKEAAEAWNKSWLGSKFPIDTSAIDAFTGALSAGGGGGAGAVTGSQAAAQKQIAAIMGARGYDRTTIAAIIGNLMQESNLNPAAVGDRGASRGIAQWNRAAGRGVGLPADLAGQVQYLMRDLEKNYPGVLAGMRGKSLAEATRIFMAGYENPGDPRFGNRLRQAQAAFGRIGGVETGGAAGGGITIPAEGAGTDKDFEKTEQIIQELTEAYIERNKAVDDYVQGLHEQREMEEATAAGDTDRIARLKAEAEIRRLNVAAGSEQAQQIEDATLAYERFAKSQELAAQAAQQMADFGQMLGDAVSGFVQDLMNGVDAGEAFANMLKRLAAQLMDMAIKQLFSGIFGTGQVGSGLFGGMFGGGAPAMAGAGAGAGMIRMGGGALKSGSAGNAITVGGATINVAGNADTRTVAMMSKMLEVNNQQQSARLDREWGRRSARYKSLRSP